MDNKIVRLKPGFFLERMDDEIVVYHTSLTTSLYFNETGALVWQLCDGKRTVGQIIDVLCQMYPESADQIKPEVSALIASLLDKQVAELL
jgi:hypothetical protein